MKTFFLIILTAFTACFANANNQDSSKVNSDFKYKKLNLAIAYVPQVKIWGGHRVDFEIGHNTDPFTISISLSQYHKDKSTAYYDPEYIAMDAFGIESILKFYMNESKYINLYLGYGVGMKQFKFTMPNRRWLPTEYEGNRAYTLQDVEDIKYIQNVFVESHFGLRVNILHYAFIESFVGFMYKTNLSEYSIQDDELEPLSQDLYPTLGFKIGVRINHPKYEPGQYSF